MAFSFPEAFPYRWFAVGTLCLLSSCALLEERGFITIQRPDPVAREAQRARAAKETAVALTLGARVCRLMAVGIGTREWVRGVVVQPDPERVSVRIEEPGQYPHVIEGVELSRGAVVKSATADWIPCL
jgi:hypothetical protein